MKAKHDVDVAATRKTAQERHPRTRPTELEMCVLAIVSESGPCTAYFVARSLESSVSSFWSSSSGSVYPLLSRLLRRRWVTARRHDWGKRGKVRFVPTREGRRLLDAWLGAPLPGWAAAYTVDPVRTRVFFLGLVSPRRRREFVRSALEKTLEARDRLRLTCGSAPGAEDVFGYLGRLGALRQLEARVRWLKDVACALR